MAPPKVTESLRSNAKVPLSVIFPEMLPLVPPLPIWSVPALIVVPPERAVVHTTVIQPHSDFICPLLLQMTTPKVTESLRSYANGPFYVTIPVLLPLLTPLPYR